MSPGDDRAASEPAEHEPTGPEPAEPDLTGRDAVEGDPSRADPAGPNPVEPAPTGPDDPRSRPAVLAAPAPVLLLALAAGVWCALTLRHALGVNLLVAAGFAGAAAWCVARRRGVRAHGWQLLWALFSVGFAALPALRDDSWLHSYTTVAAFGFGALALTGPQTWSAMFARPLAVVRAVPAGVLWGARGVVRRRGPRGAALRGGVAALGLLVVFGALFAMADAVVAAFFVIPLGAVDPRGNVGRVLVGAGGAVVVLAAAFVAVRPRPVEPPAKRAGARRTVEWALPLLVLDAVFAVFVFVQIAVVVFDGYQDVLARKGVNYAEYARQGFVTLIVVTALTLAVLAVAAYAGPARGAPGRRLFEALTGILCVLTLVVVVAALHRLELYVDYSGLTRLRLCAATFELWLGVVVVLVLVTGPWAAAARRLPRVVGASGAAVLLALGLVSPDALIARVDLDRQRETGVVDARDLEGLSADAVPWLDRFPEPQRTCLLRPIAADLAHGPDAWFETNLARSRARALLARRPLLADVECEPAADDSGGDRDDTYDPYAAPASRRGDGQARPPSVPR
ncbi:DUF4153 domain-containing protein [Yinghuangia seranimata]|uniref:DUF4153 domain-containing protein n=1 Tax=Yinghuangia seranimata TaxID=408067 RepID=UPI00248B8C20|nr:DUF4173 domain-containing protein [Yinghuangia seranimata]MDI2132693.1 DUF4173 domain-containing protein [Yinghuangia seranimata]